MGSAWTLHIQMDTLVMMETNALQMTSVSLEFVLELLLLALLPVNAKQEVVNSCRDCNDFRCLQCHNGTLQFI